MGIEGVWKAAYSPVDVEESEEFDGDRAAVLTFSNGTIEGNDSYGGLYKGTYKVGEGRLQAEIQVTNDDSDAATIYESVGLVFPLDVNISTEYNSTDHIVIKGTINGSFPIVGHAHRLANE